MKFPALETVQILLLFAWGASSFRLTVLHTNDLHSRFDLVTSSGSECRSPNRKNCYGGVARLKYAVEQIKKQHPNSIFVNAGDFFQVILGSLSVYKAVLRILKLAEKENTRAIKSLVLLSHLFGLLTLATVQNNSCYVLNYRLNLLKQAKNYLIILYTLHFINYFS